jgi:hypothetical protein
MKSMQKASRACTFWFVLAVASLLLAATSQASGLWSSPKAPSLATAEKTAPGNAEPVAAGNAGVLPPWTHPYGASYGEWAGRWWRWILSVPAGSNPLVDDASTFCDAGQSGPVWFLVGQNGEHGCTIPTGRAIFFPIINAYVNSPCPFPECAAALTSEACAEDPVACTACLQSLADDFLGSVTDLNVVLDGRSLGNLNDYRAGSGLFSFAADPSLHFIDGCLTDEPQPFLADGFWIMLAPLRVGSHTLHFSASGIFLGSPFAIDVTYDLTVEASSGRGRNTTAPKDPSNARWGAIKELYR